MHDRLVLPRLSWAGWLTVAGVFETYSLLAWLVLSLGYRRLRPFDLGLAFLVADC